MKRKIMIKVYQILFIRDVIKLIHQKIKKRYIELQLKNGVQ